MKRLATLSVVLLALLLPSAHALARPADPGVEMEWRGRVLAMSDSGDDVRIDGDLAEWRDLARGVFHQVLDHARGPLREQSVDLAAIQVGRGPDGLHVAIRVFDEAVHPAFSMGEHCREDYVSLFLDLRQQVSEQGPKLGDPFYSRGVHHLRIRPPAKDAAPASIALWGRSSRPAGELQIAGRRLADGYALEIYLPNGALHGLDTKRLAEPIGLDVLVNDADEVLAKDGPSDPSRVSVPDSCAYAFSGSPDGSRNPAVFPRVKPTPKTKLPHGIFRLVPARLLKIGGHWSLVSGAVASKRAGEPAERLQSRHSFRSDQWCVPADQAAVFEVTGESEYRKQVSEELGATVHLKTQECTDPPLGRYEIFTTFKRTSLPEATRRYVHVWGGSYDDVPADSRSGPWRLREVGEFAEYLAPAQVLALSRLVARLSRRRDADGGWVASVYGRLAPEAIWSLSEDPTLITPLGLRVDLVSMDNLEVVTSCGPIRVRRHGPWLAASFPLTGDGLSPGTYDFSVFVIGADEKAHPAAWNPRPWAEKPEDWVLREPVSAFEPGVPHPEVKVTSRERVLTRAVRVGDPNRNRRFHEEEFWNNVARGVKVMQLYEGRIYLAGGDSGMNSGPIDIWSFAPKEDGSGLEFRREITADDEEIQSLRVYDGKLYAPGQDACESWALGNLYVKSDGVWSKLRTVPNAVHVQDVAVCEGKLYLRANITRGRFLEERYDSGKERVTSLGTSGGNRYRDTGLLLESSDEGRTWNVCALKDGSEPSETLAHRMIVLGDSVVLASVGSIPNCLGESSGPLSRGLGLRSYRCTDGVLERLPPLPCEIETGGSLRRIVRFGEGAIGAVFTHDLLYYQLHSCRPVGTTGIRKGSDRIEDLLVRGETLYVLVSRKPEGISQESIPEGWPDCREGLIWKTDDLEEWRLVAEFRVPSPPRSFEILDEVIYVGLGGPIRIDDPLNNEAGTIWRIED